MNDGGKHVFRTILKERSESANLRQSSVKVGSVLGSSLSFYMTYLVIEKFCWREAQDKMADTLEKDEAVKLRKPSASLVTDVLLKSGRLEKEDITSCVKKALQKADEVKASFSFLLSLQ